MYGNCGGAVCEVRVEKADYAEALMNWAKAEIVKEKVKAKLEAKYGKELDKLASTIVEVMTERNESNKKAKSREEQLEDAWDSFDDMEVA